MTLTKLKIKKIENVLINSLRNKFLNYKPEPASMPFHTRLLGKDRLALYSFIHSLSTNFGTAIFEPVAITLAEDRFKKALKQQTAGQQISTEAHRVIQEIMNGLETATAQPNKVNELERLRKVCQKGKLNNVRMTKVDIWLESKTGELHLFDLKTAKPNAGGFREFKRTLLEWAAAVLLVNPNSKINTLIAIPYNPYEPEPYKRWTMRGMLDLERELKVGKEFWDFVGGKGAYEELLDCFERVGIELRPEIDNYFKKFNR
ncbi:MAG: TdeIII family type II restriction endonuclease [Chlorobi bacterium]|nr:TdeIII family type II restriction endonuclease [Chlorobiota bacterium]MCI0715942.1 TdeIII family type II restriction endonuclease [Chlorobiota bacterium]